MPLEAAVLAGLLQSCAPNVAPATMVAIIRVESEGDPHRIGVNSGASLRAQPTNRADAVATARSLLRRGASFDAGLMQINSANFARLGLTPENVFDPCTNLRAGAAVLADNYSRARDAGHANPLQAAVSEYNTGSRTRGLSNGYVHRVYAAAGQANNPLPLPRAARASVSYSNAVTPGFVGGLLRSAFGGRITDTLRPMNASYGAERSYHKFGQAVDFVPAGGLHSITREQIRALMSANGVKILELLGPGDPGHSDHWHIAFASGQGATPAVQPAWSVAVLSPSDAANEGAFRVASSLMTADGDGEAIEAEEPAPPAWDVFATASYMRRAAADGVQGL